MSGQSWINGAGRGPFALPPLRLKKCKFYSNRHHEKMYIILLGLQKSLLELFCPQK